MRLFVMAGPDERKFKALDLCLHQMSLLYPGLVSVVCPKSVSDGRETYGADVIDENAVIDKRRYESKYGSLFEKPEDKNWYYQQFLKLRLAETSSEDYVVVWDGDTVPLRRVEFFKDGKYLFNRKRDYFPPYFRTVGKLFPDFNLVDKCPWGDSFISEYMAFDTNIVREMLSKFGTDWVDFIVDTVGKDHLDRAGFSEFETYGTYMANVHHDMYENVELKTDRFGTRKFRHVPDYDELMSGKGDLDTISFEAWDIW